MRIGINKYYRLVCDNDACILFREGQGNVPREDNGDEEKPKEWLSSYALRPTQVALKAKGKEGYTYARSLGLDSRQANKLRNKSKKEIEEAAKELVRA